MASNIPVPAPMDCSGDVAGNWEFFLLNWTDYENATELCEKSMKIRTATFRSILGRDAQRILQHIQFHPPEKREDLPSVIEALQRHFIPQRNEVFERYVFNSAAQEPGENIDNYVTRLRRLAATCNFKTTADNLSYEDNMIRDRLILGTSDSETRARTLRERELDLNKVIRMLKTSETASRQLRLMSESTAEGENVNFVRKKSHDNKEAPSQKKNTDSCKYCGRRHAQGKCPAYGKVCTKCHKRNHFAIVCRSESHINQLEHINVQSDTSRDDFEVNSVDYYVASMSSVSKGITTVLRMRDIGCRTWCDVECQLDTGATCNVMNKDDFLRVTGKCDLRGLPRSSARLRLYDGSVIKPLGEYTFEVQKVPGLHLNFQIVNSYQKPLLSASTCQTLGLITINSVSEVMSQTKADPIMDKYSDVFCGIGCFDGEYHMIMDPNVKPVQHQPRRVPIPMRDTLKAKLQELVNFGILKQVTEPTDWISSLVVTRKKSGQLRICIDPRDLNKGLKRAKYVMPTLDEILPRLSNAKVFSVLDAKDGFYHVKLDEESSFLTTFNTPFGRYRWLRMPQGISSAPEEYQRRQYEAIQDLKGVEVIADDTLVFGCGDTVEEATMDHDRNLEALLQRARDKNLKFNRAKLCLRCPSVSYMGHTLSAAGLSADKSKVEAILSMNRPTDVASVQRLLGFVNYLARFMPHLSDVCEPLRRLTDRDSSWDWQSSQELAFQNIKQLVTEAPVLRYYSVVDPVTLQCDSSDFGLGATLLQCGQPVAFASRALSPVEQRYAQIEKEMLSIVFGCERFRQYICGRKIIQIHTDHKPLEMIFQKPLMMTPKRLQSMRLRLQDYSLKVTYIPGRDMHIADFLSRAPLPLQPSEVTQSPECVFKATKLKHESEINHDFEEVNATEFLCATDSAKNRMKLHLLDDPVLSTLMQIVLKGWPEQKKQIFPVQSVNIGISETKFLRMRDYYLEEVR